MNIKVEKRAIFIARTLGDDNAKDCMGLTSPALPEKKNLLLQEDFIQKGCPPIVPLHVLF